MNEVPPTHDVPPVLPSSFQDRRTGLILFGVLEILLGVLCLLMAGFMVLGQMMLVRSTGAPLSMQMLIPGMLVYAGMAIAFVWLGIGSIQWSFPMLGYLLWAKRFFRTAELQQVQR